MQAKFIVVEGLEGAGKSTAVEYINQFLQQKGLKYINVREPGGTFVAERIRDLIKDKSHDEIIDPKTEVLLLYAARLQLVNNVIKPALANNTWVIADRHDLSTIAYQCGGRGLDLSLISTIKQTIIGDFTYDFCIYLDINPGLGLQRARGRGELDRIEQENLMFFTKIRNKYLEIVNNHKNIAVIDINADKTREEIKSEIFKLLQSQYG